MEILMQLVAQLDKLVGVAALIVVLVNVLKFINVATDGTAPTWAAGFYLVTLVGLFVARVLNFDVSQADAIAGTFAQLIAFLLTLVAQLGLGKLFYWFVRGVPIIGFSHTLAKSKSS